MITTISLPPGITEHFNRLLLSTPIPKLFDDSETLFEIYKYINEKLKRKCNTEIKLQKFELLEEGFIKLYERIKEKEKELEEKNEYPHKMPFTYFEGPNRNGKSIFGKIIDKASYGKY